MHTNSISMLCLWIDTTDCLPIKQQKQSTPQWKNDAIITIKPTQTQPPHLDRKQIRSNVFYDYIADWSDSETILLSIWLGTITHRSLLGESTNWFGSVKSNWSTSDEEKKCWLFCSGIQRSIFVDTYGFVRVDLW